MLVGEGAIGNADKNRREGLVLELINDLIALQRHSLAIGLYEEQFPYRSVVQVKERSKEDLLVNHHIGGVMKLIVLCMGLAEPVGCECLGD